MNNILKIITFYSKKNGCPGWIRTNGIEGSEPSALPLGYRTISLLIIALFSNLKKV